MILETGNMWEVFDESDLWLFTGNSYINQKGELVMGQGLASDVKLHCPEIAKGLGGYIKTLSGGHLGVYGLVLWSKHSYMGAFQVKQHYQDKAQLALIGFSCIKLMEYLKHNTGIRRVNLNFPGIGYGRLDRSQVLPIISELPDIVHIWENQ